MDTAETAVERIDQIEARLDAIADRMREIDGEHSDSLISGAAADEWNQLGEEKEKLEELAVQMEARRKVLETLGKTQRKDGTGMDGFSTSKPREDIFDISAIRGQHNTVEGELAHYADNAKRAIEAAIIPNPLVDVAEAKTWLERRVNASDDGVIAKRILLTGSDAYQRAFQAQMMQWVDHPKARPLSAQEEGLLKRAGSTSSASGGYAVPFTLDATLIHTSNLSVNPWRAVCRQVTITTTTWKAVTSGSVTATRTSEAGTASDNMSTLTQPSGTPTRVQSFVPFSVEIEGDWPEMQSEIALLIQEAKDDEETLSLYSGSGTAPAIVGLLNTANGLTTSQRVQTSGTAAFAIGDVYALQQALPPRIRGRESYLGSNYAWSKVRQFDTAGGAGLFAPTLRDGLGTGHDQARLNIPLLGRPAYELSSLGAALTSATKLMVGGDFSRFVIVDRVGMNLELVPMIQSGGLPTGQRGIYAWWRNCSVLTDANAFRYLETL